MPADMCEGDDLLGVFSGALINGEIEYPPAVVVSFLSKP